MNAAATTVSEPEASRDNIAPLELPHGGGRLGGGKGGWPSLGSQRPDERRAASPDRTA